MKTTKTRSRKAANELARLFRAQVLPEIKAAVDMYNYLSRAAKSGKEMSVDLRKAILSTETAIKRLDKYSRELSLPSADFTEPYRLDVVAKDHMFVSRTFGAALLGAESRSTVNSIAFDMLTALGRADKALGRIYAAAEMAHDDDSSKIPALAALVSRTLGTLEGLLNDYILESRRTETAGPKHDPSLLKLQTFANEKMGQTEYLLRQIVEQGNAMNFPNKERQPFTKIFNNLNALLLVLHRYQIPRTVPLLMATIRRFDAIVKG